MTNYTDEQLEAMLVDLESDLSERKESIRGETLKTVPQAICAFANDLPNHQRAGVVFVGARDDGSPSGQEITDQLILTLANMKTDGNIVPPPTMTVSKRTLRGAPMAVVCVMPSDSPPVRYSGRICIRTGSRRGDATAQDERILNEKRRFRDLPFDAHPVPSATLADLNIRVFEEEYLPRAVSADVLAANERTMEQRLAACKMIASADDPTPTVLGLLVLGTRPRDFLPGAYIQFLRIEGTELSDPVGDDQIMDGSVGELLRRVDDKLAAHNRRAVSFTEGPTETRTQLYPHSALQQLVRNGVMHRAYENTNAPVRVYWYDDRIEILSPGGVFGSVTEDKFGEPGYTDYRNPNLAEALHVLGFVQQFGMGIPTARKALATNGNPAPTFDVSPTRVQWTLKARPWAFRF